MHHRAGRLALALLVLSMSWAHGADTGFDRPIQPATAWERIDKSLIWGFENMYHACVLEFPGEEHAYKCCDRSRGSLGTDKRSHPSEHDTPSVIASEAKQSRLST